MSAFFYLSRDAELHSDAEVVWVYIGICVDNGVKIDSVLFGNHIESVASHYSIERAATLVRI